jgi:hypothetical protein
LARYNRLLVDIHANICSCRSTAASRGLAGAVCRRVSGAVARCRRRCGVGGGGRVGAERGGGLPPKPPGSSALTGLSCVSATACEAVGSFVEGWSGGTWTIQPTPSGGGLNGVSCTSVTACTAVGSGPLAIRWHGGIWRLQTTPIPSGAVGGSLSGVSCPSASACIAVGEGDYPGLGGTIPLPMGELWSGTAWTSQTTPSPSAGRLSVGCRALRPPPALALGTHSPSPPHLLVTSSRCRWRIAGTARTGRPNSPWTTVLPTCTGSSGGCRAPRPRRALPLGPGSKPPSAPA